MRFLLLLASILVISCGDNSNNTIPDVPGNNLVGLVKYTVFTDCHNGVPVEKCPELFAMSSAQAKALNAYSIGDNFELKNCDKKNQLGLERSYAWHKAQFVGRFVSGNHDAQGYSNDYDAYVTQGNMRILFTHGDFPLWGNAKSMKFRNETHGQGWGFIQKVLANKTGSISNSEAAQLADYAIARGANVIISGHVHVAPKFEQVVKGVRVINLPRGKNELWL